MKATGIVRRIDDLGRVVIPKEIRRTQRIREGDPLEIFTTGDGEVVFKKYSPMGEVSRLAAQYAEALAKALGCTALICDRDHILAAAGPGRRDYADRRVSLPLERMMESRSPYAYNGHPEDAVFPCEESARHILAAAPILAAGDVVGAVLTLSEDKRIRPSDQMTKCISVACAFLGDSVSVSKKGLKAQVRYKTSNQTQGHRTLGPSVLHEIIDILRKHEAIFSYGKFDLEEASGILDGTQVYLKFAIPNETCAEFFGFNLGAVRNPNARFTKSWFCCKTPDEFRVNVAPVKLRNVVETFDEIAAILITHNIDPYCLKL